MQYSQNGEHRMTVVVEVRASHGYVRLQHPSRASDRTEHMDYTVGLIWTVPQFVGRRWWFSCPLSGRRCGVLYLPRGASKFASAKGHGLDYAVTRMSKRDQIWRRMARISGRLGGEPGPQGPPPRPDGMRAATYRHQLRLWRRPRNAWTPSPMPASAASCPHWPACCVRRRDQPLPKLPSPGQQPAPPAVDAPADVSKPWPHFVGREGGVVSFMGAEFQ